MIRTLLPLLRILIAKCTRCGLPMDYHDPDDVRYHRTC